ncbi:hypothetical protein ACPWT1_07780 [Ramlibacter sp. MMS24-I3-19]|uniref:hypothetical protein n=1 Tax=Ramlibacter sp. MMS24-I3-19 TaxID=3416606 RepID=UPI003D02ED1E
MEHPPPERAKLEDWLSQFRVQLANAEAGPPLGEADATIPYFRKNVKALEAILADFDAHVLNLPFNPSHAFKFADYLIAWAQHLRVSPKSLLEVLALGITEPQQLQARAQELDGPAAPVRKGPKPGP